jgi:mannose-6-phosphate isomerase-like protein (cupin superfamily)
MSNAADAVNLDAKFGKFTKHWSPHIVALMNEFHVKAVKVKDEFVWHQRDDIDKLFFVYKGLLTIKYEDRDVTVKASEVHVVPKGVQHKPVAA